MPTSDRIQKLAQRPIAASAQHGGAGRAVPAGSCSYASAQAEWPAYLDGDVELPQNANLFDEIRAAFPTHDASFCPTARGALHDSDGKTVRSEFGLATFVRRSYP